MYNPRQTVEFLSDWHTQKVGPPPTVNSQTDNRQPTPVKALVRRSLNLSPLPDPDDQAGLLQVKAELAASQVADRQQLVSEFRQTIAQLPQVVNQAVKSAMVEQAKVTKAKWTTNSVNRQIVRSSVGLHPSGPNPLDQKPQSIRQIVRASVGIRE